MEKVDSRKRVLLCVSCLCLLFSCIDHDGGFPITERIPVVNGMLKADSILSINLTWSNNPEETDFPPIFDAYVEVFEDGVSLGIADSVDNEGTYFFKHSVKSNSAYKLNAFVDNNLHITAETKVPDRSSFSLEWLGDGSWGKEIYKVNISGLTEDVSAIYIFSYLEGDNNTFDNYGIYCNSPICDSFNKTNDNSGPDGFIFTYDEFIRIPADALINGEASFNIASYRPVQIIFLETSEEFDYYLKSAFWQSYYDPNIQMPFTWEPIQLPSNITGGTGIFGGASITLFNVGNTNEIP